MLQSRASSKTRAPSGKAGALESAPGIGSERPRSALPPALGNQAIQRHARGGEPLPADVRAAVEAFTGGNLARARVHAGTHAEAVTARHGARALTFGENIYLGAGESMRDTRLLAHEAAHVLQQRGAVGAARSGGASHDPAVIGRSEREADLMAEALSGRAAAPTLTALAGPRLALRKPVNTTTTPEFSLDPLPPASLDPVNEPHDFERNLIAEADGHWYLAEEPHFVNFPHADGAKYRLWPINPNSSYFALLARCEEIYAEERAYSDELLKRGDMKGWFARVYSYVTLNELAAVRVGKYQYPHMKLQEVIAFHTTYTTNLDAWLSGNKGQVEAHWREAFSRADYHTGGDWYLPYSTEVLYSLLPAFQAHIRFDLPRAIAAVYVTHYAGIPMTSLGDFEADYQAMGPVFEQATEDVRGDIGEEAWFIDPGSWGWTQGVAFPFIFLIPMERDFAWDKTGMIAGALEGTSTNAALERRMRASLTVSNPFASSGAFEVRGEDIQGTDWRRQPGMKPDTPWRGPEYEPAPAPPPYPPYLYFKQGRPSPGDKLEDAIRDDQDLAPYRDLALWTRQVRGADMQIVGSASSEGAEWYNKNLGNDRAFLLQFFMFRCGADFTNNKMGSWSTGEDYSSATPDPEDRNAHVTILDRGTSRQLRWGMDSNLPSEVNTAEMRNRWLYPQ